MQAKFSAFNTLTILCLLFFFSNCKNEPPQYAGGKTTFFDLKGYLKNDIVRLKQYVKKVKKTVTVNGKSEEKILENLNFEEELAPFIASDINRPAWSDSYMVKEQKLDNQDFSLEYYALKDHLKTRSLLVKQLGNEPITKINIVNAEKTLATNSETHLNYINNEGYTISTVQQLMGSSDSIKVSVIFLRE